MTTWRDLGAATGSYLKAADIPPGGWLLTITGFRVDVIEQGEGPKPILEVVEISEDVPLNVTNRNSLEAGFGLDVPSWVGRQIVCRSEKVSFQGRLVDGVRLYPHQPAQAAAPVQPVAPAAPAAPAPAPTAPVAPPPAPAAPAAWEAPAVPPTPADPAAVNAAAPETLAEQLGDSITPLDRPAA